MQAVFEVIYTQSKWGHGSGEGSHPAHTRGYRSFLQQFLKDRHIHSVVDLGCGDWQFSRLLDWHGIAYLGLDVVPFLIETNQQWYGSPQIEFRPTDLGNSALPAADLLLVKDVLQHWSQARILDFLPKLERFPYTLITNCVHPLGPTRNQDIQDGQFRYLELTAPPFSLHGEEVYSFTNRTSRFWPLGKIRWKKQVLLVTN